MTEEDIDDYVGCGLIKADHRSWCHAPEREEVPKPEPYEAIVFRDFFEAGLCFPCEDFVGEVLQRFNLQMYKLAPNALAQLGVFVMALKISRCAPCVDTFARY